MAKKSPLDKFSISKIGTGKFYTAGSFTAGKRLGLAGALRAAKAEGRSTLKNLSSKDLKNFQKIIGDELGKAGAHAQNLSYSSRRRIMEKAEKLRQKGEISLEDKQDLKKMVEALGPRSANSNEPKERAVSFGVDSKTRDAQAAKTKRFAAYRSLELGDELAQKRMKSRNISISANPLSRIVPDLADDEDESQRAKSDSKQLNPLNNPLSSNKNLPDIDIG